MNWEAAAAFALTLPGTEAGTSYRQPAVKANGHTVLNVGNEPATSFALHFDHGTIDMLMETHPATFWQSPHYRGYAVLLVRHDAPDDDLVREMIARAVAQAGAKTPPKSRRK